MLRRLRVYFTGFAIGLLMVYVFFGRDDSRDLDIWTPSQRILEDVRNDSIFQEATKTLCWQACFDLTDEAMLELWTESEVKSLNPGGDPYRYEITLDDGDASLQATIELAGEKRTLLEMRRKDETPNCDCND